MKPGVTPFGVVPLSVIDDADPTVVEALSVDHESDLVALIELYPFMPGEVPTIEWAIAGPTSVDEGDTATYTVSYGGAELAGETATITVATATGPGSGTAASGTDYTALSTVLSFTAGGATAKTVAVSTIEDTVFEGTEDFRVTLAGQSIGELVNPTVTTQLVDDEAITWGVAGSTSVAEGASGTYTVSYTGGTLAPGLTATVTVASATGALTWPDATAGSDFTALSTVLTFTGGGVTQKTVAVSTIQDTVLEGTEDFRVTIAGASAGSLGTSQVNAIVTDDDASNMNWSIAGATSVTEGSTANYTVSYTGVTLASGQTATIVVASATGGNTDFTDASSGSDFTALSTTLTFTGGGVTQKTVAVSTIQDTSVEGTEDFRVTIGSQSAGSLSTSQAVTLIADDEGASLTLSYIGSNGVDAAGAQNTPLHASSVAGDLVIMFCRGADETGDVTPPDWVVANMQTSGTVRAKMMAGVLTATDISNGYVAGVKGTTRTQGILTTLRPAIPITSLAWFDTDGQITTGNPASQAIAASVGDAPLVVAAAMFSSGAIDPRTWTGGTPTEYQQASGTGLGIWLLHQIFNSSPADITVDMDDEGSTNVLLSGYLEVA
jgi:hypothetical protein